MRVLVCVAVWLLSAGAALAGGTFQGPDWTLPFRDSCGLPAPDSATWVVHDSTRMLRMTLRPSEVGRCSTDNQRRHRAPFWERAEIAQVEKMPLGAVHQIAFTAILTEGFTGARETFFQIHGWTQDCNASPPLMMKAHQGRLTVWGLQRVTATSRGKHRKINTRAPKIDALLGTPLTFELRLDTRVKPTRVSMDLNGVPLVSEGVIDYAACARPHIKLGVYRPGGKGSATSTVLLSAVRVTAME